MYNIYHNIYIYILLYIVCSLFRAIADGFPLLNVTRRDPGPNFFGFGCGLEFAPPDRQNADHNLLRITYYSLLTVMTTAILRSPQRSSRLIFSFLVVGSFSFFGTYNMGAAVVDDGLLLWTVLFSPALASVIRCLHSAES